MTEPYEPINAIFGSDGSVLETSDYNEFGLTKREYFAARAMQGLIAGPNRKSNTGPKVIAENAVQIADRLIEELNYSDGD